MYGSYQAIRLAEMRREEMLQQGAQYRLAKSAAGLNCAWPQRASDLRTAVMALGARIDAMRRRRAVASPIELIAAASKTA